MSNIEYLTGWATGLFSLYSTSAGALEVKCNSYYSACLFVSYLVENDSDWSCRLFACVHVFWVHLWLRSICQNAPSFPAWKISAWFRALFLNVPRSLVDGSRGWVISNQCPLVMYSEDLLSVWGDLDQCCNVGELGWPSIKDQLLVPDTTQV